MEQQSILDASQEGVDSVFKHKEKQPEEDRSLFGSMFNQVTYLDEMYSYVVDGKKPFAFSDNDVKEDGYSRDNKDVVDIIKQLNPTEDELEILAQAKNYNTFTLLTNSIQEDRKDYAEISKHSSFLTIPSMLALGMATDPIGTVAGLGVGKIAASSLIAIKTAKAAHEAKIAATTGEAIGVSVLAGASGGLASEYALQKANNQISSEGLYLSAGATALFSGLLTKASLSIGGANRTEFFDSLDREAKIFNTAEDLAKVEPTAYEKFLGKISFGGTNKMATSNSEAVRTHAYEIGDVSIVRDVTVGNDSAIDIKTAESGNAINTSMNISKIDAKRQDLDVDKAALHEMYNIEAEYSKQKDIEIFNAEKAELDRLNEIESARIKEESLKEVEAYKTRVDELHAKAKAEGRKRYKRDLNKLEKEHQKNLKNIEKSRIEQELDVETSRLIKENIESTTMKGWIARRIDSVADEDVRASIKLGNEYFKATGNKFKKIKYANMENIDTNFYITHRYDPAKISADIEGATNALYTGLKDMISGKVDEVKLKEFANKQIRKIVENEKFNSILDPDTDYMKELKTILPGGTVFKGRKLRLNAYHMRDFMRDNLTEVIQDYGHKSAGKIALKQKFNIDSDKSKNDYLRKFVDSPSSEIKNIKHSLDSIDGSVDLDPYRNTLFSKSARFMTNLNYINLGGFFGLNTLSELGTVVMFDGIRAFNHIVPAMKQLVVESKTSPELRQALSHMRVAIDRTLNERMNLFADPSIADNSGRVDKAMTYLSNRMAKYSGLTTVTDVLDGVSALTFVAKVMSPKKSKGHVSDLKLMGLSEKDISELRKVDWVEYNSFGAVENFDINKIKDSDLRWKVQRATARNVRGTVLKGDSIQLPRIMTEINGSKALARLMFQFMRFPAIAHDKILIRFASNPRAVNGLVGTTTSAMLLWALEELKQMERKKKLTDEEIATKVASRMPMFGGIGLGTQMYDGITRGGIAGASVATSRLDQAIDIMKTVSDGKELNSYKQQQLQSYAIPYTFLGTKTLAREIGILDR